MNPAKVYRARIVLPLIPSQDGADQKRHDDVGGDVTQAVKSTKQEVAQQISSRLNDELDYRVGSWIVTADDDRDGCSRGPRYLGLQVHPMAIAQRDSGCGRKGSHPRRLPVFVGVECLVVGDLNQRVADEPIGPLQD